MRHSASGQTGAFGLSGWNDLQKARRVGSIGSIGSSRPVVLDNTTGKHLRSIDNPSQGWKANIGLAAAVGLAFFLATWLSTTLMATAVYSLFWPAVGIASGLLIGLGPRARWPIAAGVFVANVVINLAKYQGVVNASAFIVGNTLEPLIVARLVQYFIGARFDLGQLRHLFALFGAALLGCGTLAVGWAAVVHYTLGLPPLGTWLDLTRNDTIGVVLVAPLMIALVGAVQEPPPRREIVEGSAAIMLLVAVTAFVIWLPQWAWDNLLPVALLFPLFLWLAARCQPLFPAAGGFLVSMMIISTTIFGIGHFGHDARPVTDRSLEAVSVMLFVTVSALVLAALITERKESEARLAKANAMLERERDNKLMSVQAAVASISHEIKQPLASIVLNAEAAQSMLRGEPPDLEEAHSALNDVIGGGHRAGEILASVRQLFSKGERRKTPINVNEVALSVLRFLREELSNHQVTTAVGLGTELPPVMGHRVQLEEVIANLVRNSIQAMDAVETSRRTLKVSSRLGDAEKLILEVEDTGPGIHPEALNSIFEAFNTTKVDGTGLGLAICRTIIERHGGALTASSDGRSGALFRAILPISPLNATNMHPTSSH
jgi:signal transduction histidine kinase